MCVVLCGPDGHWDHVVSHVGVALLGYWRIYVRMAARVGGIMPCKVCGRVYRDIRWRNVYDFKDLICILCWMWAVFADFPGRTSMRMTDSTYDVLCMFVGKAQGRSVKKADLQDELIKRGVSPYGVMDAIDSMLFQIGHAADNRIEEVNDEEG